MIDESLVFLVMEGRRYVESALPRFSAELSALCLLESPSNYQPGLDAMADAITDYLRRLGLQVSSHEHAQGGKAVLGTLKGSDTGARPILLLCHHDTVHPLGVANERVRIDGTRLYGPGTVDMKGCILLALYALEILLAQQYRIPGDIFFLSVPDEEIAARYQLDFVLELCQQQPLVLVLEGARSIGNVVTARKGGAFYRLTAQGVAAHAGSAPEKGKNAILELAHQIVQLCALHGWREGLTINVGPVRGGSQPNVVSDFAEALFDMRYRRIEDRDATEERWQALLQQQLVPGVRLTLQREPNALPPMVPTETSLWLADQLKELVEEIFELPFDPETRGGCSDGCHTAMAGCPTIDGLGAIGGKAHSAGEYIELESIPQRAALLAGLIAAAYLEKV